MRNDIPLDETFHVVGHRLRIDFSTQPGALKSDRASLQVPWIGTQNGSFEDAVRPLFAKILLKSSVSHLSINGSH